eukprot:1204998-Rhodomonas_salina.2
MYPTVTLMVLLLLLSYALSGSAPIGYPAAVRYALSGTHLGYAATVRFAMSGNDVGYGALRWLILTYAILLRQAMLLATGTSRLAYSLSRAVPVRICLRPRYPLPYADLPTPLNVYLRRNIPYPTRICLSPRYTPHPVLISVRHTDLVRMPLVTVYPLQYVSW